MYRTVAVALVALAVLRLFLPGRQVSSRHPIGSKLHVALCSQIVGSIAWGPSAVVTGTGRPIGWAFREYTRTGEELRGRLLTVYPSDGESRKVRSRNAPPQVAQRRHAFELY
jgi:hypothetical protein